MTPDTVALWRFAVDDHEAWQQLTGDRATPDEYGIRLHDAATAAIERGCKVTIRTMSVRDMQHELAERQLVNTAESRARVIAAPDGEGLVLGIKTGVENGRGYVGWALIDRGTVTKTGTEQGEIAEIVRRLLAS